MTLVADDGRRIEVIGLSSLLRVPEDLAFRWLMACRRCKTLCSQTAGVDCACCASYGARSFGGQRVFPVGLGEEGRGHERLMTIATFQTLMAGRGVYPVGAHAVAHPVAAHK